MVKLSNKREIRAFTLLCSVVYFASYVSRINLGAIFVAVVESGYSPEKSVALALTLCSVTYGGGQLISGYLGDKFKPHNLIFTGFLLTSAMNILVGTVGGNALVALWAVNGFAQSLMWPPLVKIMSSNLTEDDYKKAVVKVSWGSSFGTIAVYLLAPLVVKFFQVRYVFVISAVLALFMAVTVKVVMGNVKTAKDGNTLSVSEATVGSEKGFSPASLTLLVFVMVAILCQGALRDGVTNWTPTYISEIFKLDSSLSILTGVILPVFSVLSFSFVSLINRKFVKNELLCAGVVFGVGAVSAVLLLVIGNIHFSVSLLLLALLVGSMHGVNLILVCMTPAYFGRYGKVSFVSGLINSSTYVGAAVSTYGIAIFTENFGWNKTIALWAVVAVLGTVICFGIARGWHKFKSE